MSKISGKRENVEKSREKLNNKKLRKIEKKTIKNVENSRKKLKANKNDRKKWWEI